MGKTIEKNAIIHILVFSLIILVLNVKFNINIFTNIYNNIDIATENLLSELNTIKQDSINMAEENLEEELDIIMYNKLVIEDGTYLLKYYTPAIMILLIILLVYFESKIFSTKKAQLEQNNIIDLLDKISKQKSKNKDDKSPKVLKAVIVSKKNTVMGKITMIYICATVLFLICNPNSAAMIRTLNNIIFICSVLICINGLNMLNGLITTKDKVVTCILKLINLFAMLIISPIYFALGFIYSFISLRISIK